MRAVPSLTYIVALLIAGFASFVTSGWLESRERQAPLAESLSAQAIQPAQIEHAIATRQD